MSGSMGSYFVYMDSADDDGCQYLSESFKSEAGIRIHWHPLDKKSFLFPYIIYVSIFFQKTSIDLTANSFYFYR